MKTVKANSLLTWWQRLSYFPAGKWLFSFILACKAPYSGSISAKVEDISAGQAKVSLRDKNKIRNHLNSIHAIALINLGEITTGLAVLSIIPDNMRGIVSGLEAEYIKKARGKLVATASFELPDAIDSSNPIKVTAVLTDEVGDIVTLVHAMWLLGYKN